MIVDHLGNAERYLGCHPGFPAAFEWLRQESIASLPAGRHAIHGEAVYASVIREKGRGPDAVKLETHRRYVDIQYLVSGLDVMGWAPRRTALGSLGYDAVTDLEFYTARPLSWVTVEKGFFAVFFPEDAHAPMATLDPMVKIVVKVAV